MVYDVTIYERILVFNKILTIAMALRTRYRASDDKSWLTAKFGFWTAFRWMCRAYSYAIKHENIAFGCALLDLWPIIVDDHWNSILDN